MCRKKQDSTDSSRIMLFCLPGWLCVVKEVPIKQTEPCRVVAFLLWRLKKRQNEAWTKWRLEQSHYESMRARLGGRTCSRRVFFRRFPIECVDWVKGRAGATVQRGDNRKNIERGSRGRERRKRRKIKAHLQWFLSAVLGCPCHNDEHHFQGHRVGSRTDLSLGNEGSFSTNYILP